MGWAQRNRGKSPGSGTCGSVTVEASFALVSLIVVFAMLVQGMSAIALQGALTACAREAARAAAIELEESAARAAATEQVAHCQPSATMEIRSDSKYYDISIHRRLRLFGLPRSVSMSATASALKEPLL